MQTRCKHNKSVIHTPLEGKGGGGGLSTLGIYIASVVLRFMYNGGFIASVCVAATVPRVLVISLRSPYKQRAVVWVRAVDEVIFTEPIAALFTPRTLFICAFNWFKLQSKMLLNKTRSLNQSLDFETMSYPI